MLDRFFGDASVDANSATTIFRHLDTITLLRSVKLVSASWHDFSQSEHLKMTIDKAINRALIYKNTLRPCSLFIILTPDDFSFRILKGGLTNKTYKVRLKTTSIVVRLSGEKTDEFIDRRNEKFNASISSQADISPKVFFFDETNGAQITEYLKSPQPMSVESFREEHNIREAMAILKKLHQGELFANDVDVFERNRHFCKIVETANVQLPDQYSKIAAKIDELEKLFHSLPLKKVACHNDATPSNFIRTQGVMRMIDIEYSGNNFKEYEYAYWFIEARYKIEQAKEIFDTYLKDLEDIDESLFVLSTLVAESWVALWAYVQIAVGNTADLLDPEGYANERLKNCLEIINSDVFNEALKQVKEQCQHLNKQEKPCLAIVRYGFFHDRSILFQSNVAINDEKQIHQCVIG